MRGHYGGEGSTWAAMGVCFDVLGLGGVAQAAGSVAGAAIQASATKEAAKLAVNSANRSADMVQGRYDTTRGDFTPYRDLGGQAANMLSDKLGDLTGTDSYYQQSLREHMPQMPSAMTQADLEATPGYQFTLSQGLKAVQNSASARGLGVSGAAMKGAADYATGLSNQTYAQRFANQQSLFGNQQTRYGNIEGQFANDQGMRQNAFNRLSAVTGIGQSSAAQTGAMGLQAANAAGGFLTSGASAAGGGLIAGGNAMSGGFNGISNGINSYLNQNRLYGNNDGSVYGGGNVPGGASNPYGTQSQQNGTNWNSTDQQAADTYRKLYE